MSSLRLNLVAVIVVLALAIRPSVSPIPTKTWHVHVVNNLSNNQTLFLHCKSKDDDLGEHKEFLSNNAFWCHLRKPDNFCNNFKVFWNEDFFQFRCRYKDCIWTAKDEGFYLKNIPEGRDELWQKWKQPPCN
ncbi:S-protein [Citrus sinensis]|nr:S-protein [Citrus sinensis]